jgi:hypothetical protein
MPTVELSVIADPNNPDELLLQLPDSLLESQDWKVGDTLQWNETVNGAWTLTKNDESNRD